jgi:hypothetical protein
MRQPGPSRENETRTKQPKPHSNSVNKRSGPEQKQLETASRHNQARPSAIIDSAMDDITIVVCGSLADQRNWSFTSLR